MIRQMSCIRRVSAALFAAGFYTDQRWRIRTTSHGVLIIAILLVPLNFVLWQAAYSELVFSDVLWPDVDRRHLWQAIDTYARRDRRYGGAGPLA